ncbi:hypothetical protein DPMN_037822 [Dreissena polymorpha]|uniref:Uncharacterized protein n=1 Tax=Dreissena polymorpha TaxID=45954 RepID=A0A9D4RMN1_DREPO|nr:hypothetical protein DPMN_037822 [Dreissena polymorpha]
MVDIHLVRHCRPRQLRRIDQQETDLTDDEVRRRYRFSRFSSNNIDRLVPVRLLEPSLRRPTEQGSDRTATNSSDIAVSGVGGIFPNHW